MSLNQNVRFAASAGESNPYGIIQQYKPSRIIVNNSDPINDPNGTGEDLWYFINSATGTLWEKNFGVWSIIYTFSSSPGNPGILSIQNDGSGSPLFKNLTGGGTVAHFRTLLSSTGKITFATNTNETDLNVDLDKDDVGLGKVQNIKCNFLSSVDPTNFNDSSPGEGYAIGSFWLNRSTNPSRLFICEVAIPTLAVWELISSSSSDISNVVNVGTGAFILRDVISNVANIRSLVSTNNTISATEGTDTVSLNAFVAKGGLSLIENTKYVTNSNRNPTVNDDASLNFVPGNIWANYGLGTLYICRTNTVSAAVWDFIAPSSSFTRNDNDYFQAVMQGTNHQTAFSATFTAVLLNIGFTQYTIPDYKGTVITANSGFGPVNIIYGPPSNGKVNDQYMFTINWKGRVASPSGAVRIYGVRLNVGNGGSPGAGVIEAMTITFNPGETETSTISRTFTHTVPGSGMTNYFLSAVSLSTTDTLFTDVLSIVMIQIV